MSKLDVFLWLTVKYYSVVSRRRCSIRTPFLQDTSRRLFLSFYEKILTNVNNVRQTKVQKDSFTEKKRKARNKGKRTQMPVTITEGLVATGNG